MDVLPHRALLSRIAACLGIDQSVDDAVPDPPHPVPLPSRLATGPLAWASVTAVALAAAPEHPQHAASDPDRIALAYRSDRLLAIGGIRPSVWSPYSGFWRSTDGWLRTHGNYPHHARALLRGLGLDEGAGADQMSDAIAGASVREAVSRVTAAGGLAVPVLPEHPETDARLRGEPLVRIRPSGAAPRPRRERSADADAPLHGVRVLDLTRVIAGPVCTRTLALLGADVLRVDPPALPEPDWQHLDTGHGKRSTRLDARSERMTELLGQADVVVLGYRPAALSRLGLDPDALADRYPGLVVAQLSAWGTDHPERAGFDSLVQAESGIALIEGGEEHPGALPAQALDHSAGYLLAAAICRTLSRADGRGWHIDTSLRRVAAELLGMPRSDEPGAEREIDPTPHAQRFTVGGRALVTARAAIPGFSFAAPRPWGEDLPGW